MADDETPEPVLRNAHHQREDKLATEFVNRTGKLHHKTETKKDDGQQEKEGPAGGFDSTPLPNRGAMGYTLKITFHRAENLPFSDINTISSDPYIHVTIKTDLQKRHKQDPDLMLRTRTIHRNVNPQWNTEWIIANVPPSGFSMKCRLYDEDPADHDDRLGNAHVEVGRFDDSWTGLKEQAFDIKKRMGSKRAYFFRGCAAMFNRNISMGGKVYISIENLGKTEAQHGGRMWTIGPLAWSRHYSPMIGRLAGTKDVREDKNGKKNAEKYNFQAVQIQLQGPVPEALYHRYVEFKPFVAGMFTSHSLRGRILNRALHHQHARVYNYDRSTLYGLFPKPCIELSKQFLDFVKYDQGGRIFTYIVSLDGLWRFTETGKEFGIDLLSKHTMHSNVSIYIAFSGEFFIRRLKKPHRVERRPSSETQLREGKGGDPQKDLEPPGPEATADDRPESADSHDPSHYELVIDNDSGTYRPNAKLLYQLREFMEKNLPGLRVTTLDCQADSEKMNKLKDEQRERKKAVKGGKEVTYQQNMSTSSLSSSEAGNVVPGNKNKDQPNEKHDHPEAGPEERPQQVPTVHGQTGATRTKYTETKDKANTFKHAAMALRHMGPGANQSGEDQKNEDGVGGFVGEDAPVLRNEKSGQTSHATPDQEEA